MMGECCEGRFKNKKTVMEDQIAHNCQIKAESHFECVNSSHISQLVVILPETPTLKTN